MNNEAVEGISFRLVDIGILFLQKDESIMKAKYLNAEIVSGLNQKGKWGTLTNIFACWRDFIDSRALRRNA